MSPPARADESNRNLFPFGEREALLANTGITSASSGAVFYNPGNLARLTHSEISASGTTLMRFSTSTEALLVIEGEDQKFEASGFLVIPASLVSTYHLGDLVLATSVLVPDSSELDNRITLSSPRLQATLVQKNFREDLMLGISAARRFGRVSVGLSLYGMRRSTSNFSQTLVTVEDPEEGTSITQTSSNLAFTVFGATAILGVAVEVHPLVTVGARLHGPLLEVADSGTAYNASLSVVDGEEPQVEESVQSLAFDAPLPLDLGVGVSYRPIPALELMLDANLQVPETVFGDGPPLDPALRVSAGAELELNRTFRALLGLRYDPSAVAHSRRNDPGVAAENYVGITGGISRQSGRTRTGLGGFLLFSRGSLVPISTDDVVGRRASFESTAIGGLLTVSYQL